MAIHLNLVSRQSRPQQTFYRFNNLIFINRQTEMTPPTPTPYQLMQMHIRALYRHDEGSRLLSINAWHSGPAPRFFLGRTEHGNLWRFRNDLPPPLCDQLNSLCQTEPFTTSDRPQHEAAYLQILSRHAPIEHIWLGPAYYFANRLTAAPEPVPITPRTPIFFKAGFKLGSRTFLTNNPSSPSLSPVRPSPSAPASASRPSPTKSASKPYPPIVKKATPPPSSPPGPLPLSN